MKQHSINGPLTLISTAAICGFVLIGISNFEHEAHKQPVQQPVKQTAGTQDNIATKSADNQYPDVAGPAAERAKFQIQVGQFAACKIDRVRKPTKFK